MKKILPFFLFLSLVLTSCEFIPGGEPLPDAEIGFLYTPGSNLQSDVATAFARTQAAAPQPTITPRPQATSTSDLPPSVTTTAGANCRGGPGTVYSVVEVVPQGTSLEITGRDFNFGWFQVTAPGRGIPCWLSGDAVSVSGSTQSVQLVAAPPTPLPAPQGGARTLQFGQSGSGTLTMTEKSQMWAFWATQGQVVSISMSGSFDVAMQLEFPAVGSMVARTDDSYQGLTNCFINNYIVTATGWHYIRASSYETLIFSGGCQQDWANWCTGTYTVRVTGP